MEKETVAVAPSKKRRRRRGNRLSRSLFIAVALLLTAFLTRQSLVAAVTKVQLLTSQEVGQTTLLEGILIKEEKPVRSPVNGRLHFTVPDGKRLEVGAGAAQVTVSGGEVYVVATSFAGIFCTHLDGLESVLSPGNLDVLEPPKLEKISGKPVAEGGRAEKGQPIFKIIDNLSPVYIYADIPKKFVSDRFTERPGWFEATWEGLPLKIKPARLADRREGYFLLSDYPEQLVHYRKVTLNVTTKLLEGFLVPRNAVVYRDGEPGIYLAVKKKAHWSPVKIEGELAGNVAVVGQELSEGARYVSHPALIREGWPVE